MLEDPKDNATLFGLDGLPAQEVPELAPTQLPELDGLMQQLGQAAAQLQASQPSGPLGDAFWEGTASLQRLAGEAGLTSPGGGDLDDDLSALLDTMADDVGETGAGDAISFGATRPSAFPETLALAGALSFSEIPASAELAKPAVPFDGLETMVPGEVSSAVALPDEAGDEADKDEADKDEVGHDELAMTGTAEDAAGEMPAPLAAAYIEAGVTAVGIPDDAHAGAGIETVLASIDAELGELKLAAPAETKQTAVLTQQVVFQLSGTNYSVPIGEVLEMSTVPRTTLLPNVPDFVRGVTNLRGEVLAVIDLRVFLGLAITGDPARERMLVVRPPGSDAVAGLIVESVRGLARVANQQLRQPAGPLEDPVIAYLAGVTEHEDQVLHALDLRKLFRAPEIVSLSAR